MKNTFVAMGEYYTNNHNLIRTVCKAYDYLTNEPMIIYVNIEPGGYVSEAFSMPENEFINTFM